MSTDKLEKYTVFVKLTVLGESPEDALDYANSAIDHSDLLDQDGVVSIALDEDTIEQDEEELGYGEDYDFEE
jgi:hypothetical protein